MMTPVAGPRTTILGSLFLVLALALSALVGTSAASADDHLDTPAPYLALGDSLPYGWDPVSLPFPLVRPDFHVGYPEIYAALADLALTNASCPGETSGSFLDRDMIDNGCGDVLEVFGLKVAYGTGSQLAFAVDFLTANPDTELVSVQLGANDLFLCQNAEAGCTPDAFAQALDTLGANLATSLGTLRSVYAGEIVVVNYYALDYRSPEDLGVAAATGQVVSEVAARFPDVVVADGFAALAPAAARAADSTCEAGLLLLKRDGTCDVHPTDRGHRLIAQALAEARIGSYLACPAAPSASIDAGIAVDVVGVHADAIICALEYGMVRGFADGTFRPWATITRGQAAAFVRTYLEVGLGSTLPEPSDLLPFDDIADSTHAQDIAALQLAGLVDGRADGSFGPNERLTRGQFAKLTLGALDVLDDPMVSGSLDLADDVVMFDDIVGTTFQSEIQALAGAGIIQGGGESTFGRGAVTRGQAASLLLRAADTAVADDGWAPIALP